MIENPACPICSKTHWIELETKTFSIFDPLPSSYLQIRRQILFEIWFPKQQRVLLKSIVCSICGFSCFSPRPDSADVDKKYTRLAEHQSASQEFTLTRNSDRKRSKELYSFLKPYLGKKKHTVLDYGGGNGRLLQFLLDNGQECSIVELVDDVLPGINYVGSKISDAIAHGTFDFIVCSHVLEHLVDPLETVLDLTKALSNRGYIYIEVPNELWRRAPPKDDPVTHINYFTPDSIRSLLERAALDVISCKYETFTRPNGLVGLAIKAIARKPNSPVVPTIKYRGPAIALAQVNAGKISSLMRLLRHPKLIKNIYRKPEN